MSDDIFNRKPGFANYTELFNVLNVGLGVDNDVQIENVLVDPFKCIVYYSDTQLNIWAVRLMPNAQHKPRRLVTSLFYYTNIKYRTHQDRKHIMQKPMMTDPTLDMTIVEVISSSNLTCINFSNDRTTSLQ
jgi:hypothetical protein